MDQILQTFNLTKKYKGRTVVDAVNINIQRGEIYGFVGENGAGKTTFMRMILGMALPTSGTYQLFQDSPNDYNRKRIGALIETPTLFENCSALENLKRFSILFGSDEHEIKEILKCVGLENDTKKKAGKFSLGMKQRLGIAIALLGNPDFLVLDEPINGLDPTGIKEIRDLILKLNQERGITFLISSHLLDELSKIATKFGILHNGKLVEEISAAALQEKCTPEVAIHVSDSAAASHVLEKYFSDKKIVISSINEILVFDISIDEEMLQKLLLENGIVVTDIRTKVTSLEQYFLRKIGD